VVVVEVVQRAVTVAVAIGSIRTLEDGRDAVAVVVRIGAIRDAVAVGVGAGIGPLGALDGVRHAVAVLVAVAGRGVDAEADRVRRLGAAGARGAHDDLVLALAERRRRRVAPVAFDVGRHGP